MCFMLNAGYRLFDESHKDLVQYVVSHPLFTTNCYVLLLVSANVIHKSWVPGVPR